MADFKWDKFKRKENQKTKRKQMAAARLRKATCRVCGAVFDSNHPRACYCSDPCRRKGEVRAAKMRYHANREHLNRLDAARKRARRRQMSVILAACDHWDRIV